MRFKGIRVACIVTSLALLPALPCRAQSVVCVNCATELTQLVNKLQMADSFIKQLEQLQQAIQQTADMVRNSKGLDDQTFSKARDDILALKNLLSQAQGISFARPGLDAQFAQKYPNYDAYVQKQLGDTTLDAKRREWSADNSSDVQTALKAAGLRDEQIEGKEQAYLDLLEGKAKSVQGRNEAIQVANLIAIEGLKQTQKLRQELLLTLRLQAGSLQREADQKAVEGARWEAFRQFTPLPTNDGARF